MPKQGKTFFVYILSSKSRNLYVGVTSELAVRLWQHKTKVYDGYTARYNINRLVYLEEFGSSADAIQREKELKGWLRSRKIALIEEANAAWADLSEEWYSVDPNGVQPEGEKQILRSSG
jgi:putative endonuclease